MFLQARNEVSCTLHPPFADFTCVLGLRPFVSKCTVDSVCWSPVGTAIIFSLAPTIRWCLCRTGRALCPAHWLSSRDLAHSACTLLCENFYCYHKLNFPCASHGYTLRTDLKIARIKGIQYETRMRHVYGSKHDWWCCLTYCQCVDIRLSLRTCPFCRRPS